MDLGIRGKTALVCAASKGLGKGCAQALAGEGVNLVITARGREALETAADEIRKSTGVKVIAVAGDITTPEGRASALAACPSPRRNVMKRFVMIIAIAVIVRPSPTSSLKRNSCCFLFAVLELITVAKSVWIGVCRTPASVLASWILKVLFSTFGTYRTSIPFLILNFLTSLLKST